MRTFFVAHAKNAAEPELTRLREELQALVTAQSGGQPFQLVLARDEWNANFEKAGGWEEWQDRVAHGYDFATGIPYFHGYIVVGRAVGRATAGIVQRVLYRRKPCFVYEDGRLTPAQRVVQLKEHAYKDGWWIA